LLIAKQDFKSNSVILIVPANKAFISSKVIDFLTDVSLISKTFLTFYKFASSISFTSIVQSCLSLKDYHGFGLAWGSNFSFNNFSNANEKVGTIPDCLYFTSATRTKNSQNSYLTKALPMIWNLGFSGGIKPAAINYLSITVDVILPSIKLQFWQNIVRSFIVIAGYELSEISAIKTSLRNFSFFIIKSKHRSIYKYKLKVTYFNHFISFFHKVFKFPKLTVIYYRTFVLFFCFLKPFCKHWCVFIKNSFNIVSFWLFNHYSLDCKETYILVKALFFKSHKYCKRKFLALIIHLKLSFVFL